MDDGTFRMALRRLRHCYPVENWAMGRHPFDVLLSIMVSQHSTDRAAAGVMERLRSRGPVTPQEILRTDRATLRRILRPAGLAGQKAPRIRTVAQRLVEDRGGSMEAFCRGPTAAAREAVMELPGVGPKTADVWLSLVAGRPTMPVDTHIWRLARRWHLAPGRNYEKVSRRLAALIPRRLRWRDHLVLITFGREVCQARRPRCGVCPVYDLCDAEEKRPRQGPHDGKVT